ncbi:galactose mutarotase [Aeromicrobium sp. CFBP 8757]|uniref:aldose epimerase family protein n=1 Tax=Aeromicrobium sp. CFBP 8757 TaxID=2775288 RepID=UPI00177DE5BE|nr:aldose epimerase family protein [Aeromicrobium sp. CFBP 8757]MBD8608766.1 galactose mutarotase [Aeromicrobium sp. CFBP 8757]
MTVETVGQLDDGRDVQVVTIGRAPGVELQVLDLGATVHRLDVTGGDGVRRNVVLGHPTPQEHLDSTFYIGGTIGRYANRIADGRFELDGVGHEVGTNDRGHSLHGGPDGFDRRTWSVERHDDTSVELALTSPDGDQGFPGEVRATVTFTVVDDRVDVVMTATTSAPTVVNMTSHVYFNLAGEGAGTADEHLLRVAAERYTPVDAAGIPEGDHAAVEGTPFDLREPTVVGEAVRSAHPQVVAASGIDHNYVLDGSGSRVVAQLDCPTTRTRLELTSDQPGLQVYTGNFLDGQRRSTSGVLLRQGDGIALEPQTFPDSPNHPEWPSAELRPGQTYTSHLSWTVSATA